MNEKLIYVVEDDASIRELITYNLQKNGFQVQAYANGETMLTDCETRVPALFVLDLMLPGMDGLDVCKNLRESDGTRKVPIIMVTAKGEEVDKVVGLELGADDYITKPFSVREFIARVKAVLRRYRNQKDSEVDIIEVGLIKIDCASRMVYQNEQMVELSYKEFELLKLLAINHKKVLTREMLLETVWGMDYMGETRTIDVHISFLRQKLKLTDCIETVRGVGYRLLVKEAVNE